MAVRYESDLLNYEFPLIVFAQLDYRIFLKSSQPEEVILGVLADFKGDSPDSALKQIIQRIEETTDGDFSLKRHFSQLRVLAQLRNLEQNLKHLIMDSISKFVSQERDVAYMVGFDKGEEKIVSSLLKKLNYNLEQIAEIAGVSVEFVKSVEQKMATDK